MYICVCVFAHASRAAHETSDIEYLKDGVSENG